jgi:hypothetical protein
MNARMVRPARLKSGALSVIALLCLSSLACFRTVDVSKLHCINNNGCPIGNYYCANGRCLAGQGPVDSSNADLPPSGLDGQAGIDGTQAKGGTGGGVANGPLGGAGGGVADGPLGGAAGSFADAPLGGTGGGVADGPLGGATSATGGTGTQDAHVGTGGTTSVPDAPISSDGRDAAADQSNGLSLGSTCASATASQCSGGSCVDGHCCGAAFCGTCQSCTGPGGTCVAVTNAEDPDTCTGSSTCDTSGACKKKIGQACTAGTDCMGGNCADGVCCNSACNGSCEYCNGGTPGTCGYVSGAPKPGHPACPGTGACQGTCNATKASCTLPGAETTCRQPSCGGTPATATNQAVCDGNGNCPNLSTTPCSPFICGATSCLTSCSSSSQCASAAACIGGACQMCPGGQSVCGNGCYNLQSDINHCGNCTNSCSGGTPLCVSGGCVQCSTLSDCPTGYQSCTSHTCICRQKSSTNSVPDAGLDSAANFASIWTPSNSDVTWSNFDADGCPGSGSLEMLPSADSGVSFVTGCLQTPSSSNTTFGFKFWQDAPNSTNCNVGTYSDGSCSTPTFSGFPPEISTSDVTRTWTGAHLIIDSGTNSIQVSCFFPQPQGTTVYLDQFYLTNNGSLF